ncbi:MAG: hypothetical protein ABIR49_09455 [Nitrosospira sp.]
MTALQLLGMGRLGASHEGPREVEIGAAQWMPRPRFMAPHPVAGSHLPAEGTAPPCAAAPLPAVAPCPAPQKPHTPLLSNCRI